MATTIITKNGSGAPAVGDLVQGELAVDLTNKTLYSKDSSGNVFKVGDTGGGSPGTFTDLVATDSFTSPGIDDNATSTAITIDANENVGIGLAAPNTKLHILDTNPVVKLQSNGASTVNAFSMIGRALDLSAQYSTIKQVSTNGGTLGTLAFCSGPSDTEYMRISTAGNVGIGTDSPAQLLSVGDSDVVDNNYIRINQRVVTPATTYGGLEFFYDNTAGITGVNAAIRYASGSARNDGELTFHTGASGSTSEAMRVDTTGNVGIGTDAPSSQLHLKTSNTSIPATIKFDNQAGTPCTVEGGSNALAFYADVPLFRSGDRSTEYMRITSAGNVGIGESSPTRNIDVRDATNASMALKVTGASQFSFINDGTTADIGVTNSKDLTFSTGSNGDVERMRIDSTGNVGIGMTAPSDRNLAVYSDLNSILSLHNSTTGTSPSSGMQLQAVGNDSYVVNYNAGGSLGFYTAGSTNSPAERMTIDSSGNVGIGATDTGNAALSVSNPNTSGNVYSRINSSTAAREAGLQFADQDTLKWTLFKPASSGSLGFFNHTGGSTAMMLDASGNLLVGTTQHRPAKNNVNGTSIDSTFGIEASATGTAAATLNRKSTDGGILSLKNDGTTIGILGTSGGTLYAGNNGSGIIFNDAGTKDIIPYSVSAADTVDNSISLGISSKRFKDGHFSGNVWAEAILGSGTIYGQYDEIPGNTPSYYASWNGASTGTRAPVLWARSKAGADIAQMNIAGPVWEFARGSSTNAPTITMHTATGTVTANTFDGTVVRSSHVIQDGAPVVDSLQIIRAFMKLRAATADPDSTVEELREKLKTAVDDIIDQFQDQIDNMPTPLED